MNILKRANENPQMDERIKDTKQELSETRTLVKKQEKESKNLTIQSQNQVNET